MKLTNFDFGPYCQTGELCGLGHNWDLHSCVHFDGFTMNSKERELRLIWKVPSGVDKNDAWGDPSNLASGCILVFLEVDYLTISPRDVMIPFSEDLTLFGISRLVPGESKDIGFKIDWEEGEDFRLLFEFGADINIEIHSSEVRLEALLERG